MIDILSYTDDDIPVIRELFIEYQIQLGIDLCFQNFEKELLDLPAMYAEPHGTILIAKTENKSVGIVALKPLESGVCEMKRLFVINEMKGNGIGKKLALKIIEIAKEKGYSIIKLDTLKRLTPAVSMYKKMGFLETKPYNFNPEEDIIYFELAL